ncbi:MAG: acylneuraminate cytidylyltransferase family protein, partial [Betaproteobacteria bacterium]|nr:acylneuraminate cytidylyltransferase family protein [Betaproteobacteria bacterium]
LGNKPLIGHSITAALDSKFLNTVVVSSEDDEICNVATKYGVQVLRRPQQLALDNIQNIEVVRHVISNLGEAVTHVVLLQPTSPFRSSNDIDRCVELLLNGNVRSVISVTPCEHHPAKAVQLMDNNEITKSSDGVDMEARRQDLPDMYRQNGAIYATNVDDLVRLNRFVVYPCKAYVMPLISSVDIDTEADLRLAEQLLSSDRSLLDNIQGYPHG